MTPTTEPCNGPAAEGTDVSEVSKLYNLTAWTQAVIAESI